MARQDIDKQKKLEPQRMSVAKYQIEALGYKVVKLDNKTLSFKYRGSEVKYFPYSGWASGKTIKDGRGLRNLVAQIEQL